MENASEYRAGRHHMDWQMRGSSACILHSTTVQEAIPGSTIDDDDNMETEDLLIRAGSTTERIGVTVICGYHHYHLTMHILPHCPTRTHTLDTFAPVTGPAAALVAIHAVYMFVGKSSADHTPATTPPPLNDLPSGAPNNDGGTHGTRREHEHDSSGYWDKVLIALMSSICEGC
ncbi:hypothetical protein BDW22DRAFT_1348260 [Trametopsis cervina]|nr:hypothetical protein BDW22DRAFT_1348260 [Trametopsis cervina]